MSGYKKIMVPMAESFGRTSDRGLFGRRARASVTFFSLITAATFSASTLAFASGFSLEDDSALIVGSDSVLYSLDLATAVGTLGDASLSSIETSNGTTTFIEDDYGFMSGAGVDGIMRLDDGVTYLSYIQPMGAGYAISQVDLGTGVLSDTQLTALSGANTRVTALAHVDNTIYAFVPGSTDTLYSGRPRHGRVDRAESCQWRGDSG